MADAIDLARQAELSALKVMAETQTAATLGLAAQ